jgi:hypothetical protein
MASPSLLWFEGFVTANLASLVSDPVSVFRLYPGEAKTAEQLTCVTVFLKVDKVPTLVRVDGYATLDTKCLQKFSLCLHPPMARVCVIIKGFGFHQFHQVNNAL